MASVTVRSCNLVKKKVPLRHVTRRPEPCTCPVYKKGGVRRKGRIVVAASQRTGGKSVHATFTHEVHKLLFIYNKES